MMTVLQQNPGVTPASRSEDLNGTQPIQRRTWSRASASASSTCQRKPLKRTQSQPAADVKCVVPDDETKTNRFVSTYLSSDCMLSNLCSSTSSCPTASITSAASLTSDLALFEKRGQDVLNTGPGDAGKEQPCTKGDSHKKIREHVVFGRKMKKDQLLTVSRGIVCDAAQAKKKTVVASKDCSQRWEESQPALVKGIADLREKINSMKLLRQSAATPDLPATIDLLKKRQPTAAPQQPFLGKKTLPASSTGLLFAKKTQPASSTGLLFAKKTQPASSFDPRTPSSAELDGDNFGKKKVLNLEGMLAKKKSFFTTRDGHSFTSSGAKFEIEPRDECRVKRKKAFKCSAVLLFNQLKKIGVPQYKDRCLQLPKIRARYDCMSMCCKCPECTYNELDLYGTPVKQIIPTVIVQTAGRCDHGLLFNEYCSHCSTLRRWSKANADFNIMIKLGEQFEAMTLTDTPQHRQPETAENRRDAVTRDPSARTKQSTTGPFTYPVPPGLLLSQVTKSVQPLKKQPESKKKPLEVQDEAVVKSVEVTCNLVTVDETRKATCCLKSSVRPAKSEPAARTRSQHDPALRQDLTKSRPGTGSHTDRKRQLMDCSERLDFLQPKQRKVTDFLKQMCSAIGRATGMTTNRQQQQQSQRSLGLFDGRKLSLKTETFGNILV